ncbi:COX15/CtaA family protein [Limnohabitans parvus]|uniref:Heme A synthase n=1 Tax=Limnohabitans parvus II-B4 TaxID=1293052 RepID=A0A315E7Z2_9BURK|nr:COX15/CtaA family protein [Limnohabitans parvus]PUE53219.1 heme A synthase [Limnohabitans parvus II-B4]
MTDVELYNLQPVFHLMGVGLAVAALPLGWLAWRQRHAAPSRRLQALTVLTLFLTFDLVLFGAFTRLTDSGLGCPDWPGCYGSASPVGAQVHITAAQTAMPTGPVTHGKAWVEMIHRYLATGVGVLILTLAAMTWWQRLRQTTSAVSPWWPTLTLVWVCLQGAFGALTVTMKLFPFIVTLHLMLGIGLLALLMAQAVRYDGWQSRTVSPGLRKGLWLAFALLGVQIALGGWVSTNYAVLACPDFPTCNGQWVPEMNLQGFALWRELGLAADGQILPFAALSALHFVHRSAAWVVLAVLVAVAWRLRQVPGIQRAGQVLLALSALQLLTGVSNVVFEWPLIAAVLHTGGAAAMVMSLTWVLASSRSGIFVVSDVPSKARHPSFDSRPAA